MNWIEIKHENYEPILCTDGIGRVHHLMFSPVSISKEATEMEPNPGDTKVVFVRTEDKPNNDKLRDILTELIKEYDSSKEVNYFIYKDFRYWFDKDTRLALKYKFEVLKNNNIESGLIWFGSVPYEVNCDEILNFLTQLELYAIQCNDITRRHLNEVKELEYSEDILRYNITKDYPQPVKMSNNVFKID